MSYPAYDSYRDSGIAWLGDIPEGWDVFPLSYLSYIYTGYAFSSEDFTENGVPLIRISDVLTDGTISIENSKKLPMSFLTQFPTYAVYQNDILMAMTGATIGKAGTYDLTEPSLLNQRVSLLRSKTTASQRFVRYLLAANFYQEHIRLTGFGGAQPNISDKQILECRVPIPSFSEQKAIAGFLDEKTAQIDALITRKEKLLELLAEKQSALITHAVTKGLDPTAPMKPSGIAWLGDIPEGWDNGKVGFFFDVQLGKMLQSIAKDTSNILKP